MSPSIIPPEHHRQNHSVLVQNHPSLVIHPDTHTSGMPAAREDAVLSTPAHVRYRLPAPKETTETPALTATGIDNIISRI